MVDDVHTSDWHNLSGTVVREFGDWNWTISKVWGKRIPSWNTVIANDLIFPDFPEIFVKCYSGWFGTA